MPRITTKREAEDIRSSLSRNERHPEMLRALLDGEMVHFDDDRAHFNGSSIRQRFGVRLRTRSVDGGRYYWTEPLG